MNPRALARAGYVVFPCAPDRQPLIKDWPTRATCDLATIERWWSKWPEALIGLPTGERNRIAVLDLDRKDGKDGVAELERLGIEAGSPVTVTTESGGEHRYFQWREGVRNKAGKSIGRGIDVRGEGGFVFAWDEGAALLDDVVGLPPWPEALMPQARESAAAGDPVGLDFEEAREILDRLDLDEWCEEREGWLRVGMALQHEFGEEGRELWDEWSAQSGKFSEGGQEKAWASFRSDRGSGVTMRTLIHASGWARTLDLEALLPEGDDDDAQDFPDAPPRRDPEERLNDRFAVVLASGVAHVIHDEHAGPPAFYGRQALATWFANDRLPCLTPDGKQTTKPISELWIGHKRRRGYIGIEFDPSRSASGVLDGPGEHGRYNLWRGWAVDPDPSASCERFLWHLEHVICRGHAAHFSWLLRWCAHMVQKPKEKPGVTIVLKGERGAGKDLVGVYLGRMMGRHCVTVAQPKHVTGNFNSHMASCLLLHIEEGFWAGDRQAEQVLKHLITSPTIQIERKGVDVEEVASCFRVLQSSNEEWSVPAAAGERRFFVLDVSAEKARDPDYFGPLFDELRGDGPAALLALLQSVDLEGFDVRNPPVTEALIAETKQGLRGAAWWWSDVLDEGELPADPLPSEDGEDLDWSTEWVAVDRERLYGAYVRKIESAKGRGQPKNRTHFGAEMVKYGIVVERREKGGKERVYVIPPLPKCRSLFRARLKRPG